MRMAIVLIGVLISAGCAKYVPVETERVIPDEPVECTSLVPPAHRVAMLPIDPTAASEACGGEALGVCLAKRAERARLATNADRRRANSEKGICKIYIDRLRDG